MNSKIQNIYRYQTIKKYGLEECLYLNESAGGGAEYSDKAKNITSRAITYFENSNNQVAAQEFSNKANSIWSSSGIFKIKVLKICRLLMMLGVEPDSINSILGRERCDGVLYYIAYKNGKPKLFAHSLYSQGTAYGTRSGTQAYSPAVLSGLKGSERATGFAITSEGLELIKKYEGFCEHPYRDNPGYSIGYGHFITREDPAWIRTAKHITKEQATQIMASDVQKIAAAVSRQFAKHIRGPLSQASGYPQAFIDMVISIAYNAGAGGMSKSPMFKALIRAPYDDSTKMISLDYLRNNVLTLFPRSCNKGLAGIVKRRRAEAEYVAQSVFKA